MSYMNWQVKGTPILEDPLFEEANKKANTFRMTLVTCESILSEDAHVLRRQLAFILEALLHWQDTLKMHSLDDLR